MMGFLFFVSFFFSFSGYIPCEYYSIILLAASLTLTISALSWGGKQKKKKTPARLFR